MSFTSSTLMSPATGAAPLLRMRSGLREGARVLLEWHDRLRQRRALRSLDGRALRDIGLSLADVEREATKPFWRA